MKEITVIVERFLDTGGSDIHIANGRKICYRVNGNIVKLEEYGTLSKEEAKGIFSQLVSIDSDEEGKRRKFVSESMEKHGHVGFGVTVSGQRFRVQASRYDGGYYIVMRALRSSPPSLEELGFPEKTIQGLKSVIKRKSGIFLVVGATGSGKSTTLAAIIDAINASFRKNIITLEDPVEYIFEPKHSNVIQKELGRDFDIFYEALRSALREDPDVLLVGEIRDRETLELALELAETGHLVFGTLHTNTVVSTIQRMVSMAGDETLTRNRLSHTLLGVIAQSLYLKKDGNMSVLSELLITDKAILANIREGEEIQINASLDNFKYCNSYNSMIRDLYKRDIIDMDTALRLSPDPKYLNLEERDMGIGSKRTPEEKEESEIPARKGKLVIE